MPVKILMPTLSPTMSEGNLASWLVKEGDSVASGDVIAEIETDKATMEVEAAEDGVLGKIVVPAGSENVAVNSVIAILLEEGESLDDIVDEAVDSGAEPPKASDTSDVGEVSDTGEVSAKPPPPTETSAPPQASPNDKRIFITPLARRLAKENNIDIALLSGSGPHARIIKADIDAALQSGSATKAVSAETQIVGESEFELVKLNSMRKVIAARLSESKQTVPHFYLSRHCELDALLDARKQLNADGTVKISVNDMIIKACGMALRQVPAANAQWAGDAIRLYRRADVSVAVAIEGGLITPIIRQVENKGLGAIAEEMRDLADKARRGKLLPEQYQGGSFSLSNLGMYGIDDFAAVINPPQACILAVGAGSEQAVVRNGAIVIRTMMTLTLSVDHRAVDGAVGAEFLKSVVGFIENPIRLLL